MLSFWRSLLTWLLVLAMPVQGLAGIGMQHCAPAQEYRHPGGVPASVEHGHGSGHGHPHPAATADAPPAASNEAPALELAHASAAASPGLTGDAKCSACAACCPALGLPDRALPLPALPGAGSLAPVPMTAVPSFIPATLDRPPRSSRG
jgi:hypothetical protein